MNTVFDIERMKCRCIPDTNSFPYEIFIIFKHELLINTKDELAS